MPKPKFFQAYFDTSGSETDKNSMLVTVGAISTEAKWKRFDRRWLEVLSKYDVKSFRLTDFENSKGPFAGWEREPETRSQFIGELIDVMNKNINKVLIRSLVLPDYERFNARYQLSETIGGPYSMTQAATLFETIDWLHDKKDPEKDRYAPIIEDGDNGQDAFKEFVAEKFSLDITYAPKKDPKTGEAVTPLNACDLIAGHHRRVYNTALNKGRSISVEEWPEALRSIRRKVPIEPGILDDKMLKYFCDTLKIPERLS